MREIIQVPGQVLKVQDPGLMLKEKSEPVEAVDDFIRELAAEMVHYLNQPPTIGIAAVQLGEKVRMIAVKWNNTDLVIINPEIKKRSSKMARSSECCESIEHGEVVYEVRRHKLVKVRGTNLEGKEITIKGREYIGCVLQHEIDHLDGILISDCGELSSSKWRIEDYYLRDKNRNEPL